MSEIHEQQNQQYVMAIHHATHTFFFRLSCSFHCLSFGPRLYAKYRVSALAFHLANVAINMQWIVSSDVYILPSCCFCHVKHGQPYAHMSIKLDCLIFQGGIIDGTRLHQQQQQRQRFYANEHEQPAEPSTVKESQLVTLSMDCLCAHAFAIELT